MDDNDSKTLSRPEFEKACRDFKAELSSEDVLTLFGAFDINRDGSIQYDEFLRVIRGDLNETRKALVLKAFERFDKNGDGVVDLEDLVGTYNAARHPAVLEGRKTQEQVLAEFLETFETHHNILFDSVSNHQVTRDEFVEYYTNVSASIDDDIYFQQMMINAWRLQPEVSTAYEQRVWAVQQPRPSRP